MNIKFSSTTTSTIVINPVNIFTDGSSKEFNKKADKVLDDIIQQDFNPRKRKHEETQSVTQASVCLPKRNFKKIKTEAAMPTDEISLPNGDRYVYSKVNGKREGLAKGYLKNGNVLDFTFVDDIPHGRAELKNPKGDRISFQYDNGKKEGKATEHKVDGTVIDFNYVNDWKEGKATLKNVFKGIKMEFKYHRGLKEGLAIFTVKDQFTVNFSFVKGTPEGYAEFICSDYKMIFNFCEGIREGFATVYYSHGQTLDIEFNEGKAVLFEKPSLKIQRDEEPSKSKTTEQKLDSKDTKGPLNDSENTAKTPYLNTSVSQISNPDMDQLLNADLIWADWEMLLNSIK